MAAKKETQSSKLVLSVVTGTGTNGKDITATRTFSAVNPAVSDDDLYTVGVALGKLQSHAVGAVKRIDTATLVAEA